MIINLDSNSETDTAIDMTYGSIDFSGVESTVDAKIAGRKVVVFSKTYCEYSKKAKEIFKEYIIKGELSTDDYEVIEIENYPNVVAIQDYLRSITGARSVRRIRRLLRIC